MANEEEVKTKKQTRDATKNVVEEQAEVAEDPDLDKEINVLTMSGIKNQLQTLQICRLMGE